jgi:hypothetical protein
VSFPKKAYANGHFFLTVGKNGFHEVIDCFNHDKVLWTGGTMTLPAKSLERDSAGATG